MLRFNNKLIKLNGNLAGEVIIPPTPVGPTIHHYPLITAGNEYGW